MVGNLLAGTDESPGRLVSRGGRRFKVYRGMASAEAAPACGWRPRASSRPTGPSSRRSCRRASRRSVPHRGEAALVVHRLVGGLRSAMSYADAHTIAEFHANARFVRITTAGLIESRPHRSQLSRRRRGGILPGVSDPLNIFITRCDTCGTRRCGVKDLFHTAGIRTTYGSKLYGDHVPAERRGRAGSGCATTAGRWPARRTSTSSPTGPRPRTPGTARSATRTTRARRGRLVRRIGGGDRDRRVRARARHRHGGLDPDPGVVVRRRRVQASPRLGAVRRLLRAGAVGRPRRADRGPTSRPAPTRSPCWRSGPARRPPTPRRWPP